MSKKRESMDAGVRELKDGVMHVNHTRSCWAIKQLVQEVEALFPETEYTVENYNERNTGLDVVFSTGDEPELRALLVLVADDTRVLRVEVDEDSDQVRVKFKPNPRTQDSRDSFELDEAWSILGDFDELGESQ